MRKNSWAVLFIIIFFCAISIYAEKTQDMQDMQQSKTSIVTVHLFYGEGCSHCSKIRTFLNDLKEEYPILEVYEHEVYHDNYERRLFEESLAYYGREMSGVPTLFVSNEIVIGFSYQKGEHIKNIIDQCKLNRCIDPLALIIDNKNTSMGENTSPEENTSSEENTSTGEIILTEENTDESKQSKQKSNKLTIPIVVSAAAVDAINPCAFAVLIILMTTALSIANKKRALLFGLAFSVSIYISYFLIGIGLLSAMQAAGLSHGFYIFVTVLAIIIGLLNIKDFFWYGKGFIMEVPLSWRPAMKKILKSATSPISAFFIGFVVSLFELPCTGGPYIVILGLLAKEVTRSSGIIYLLLYNLVFISPLIILSLVIYKGLSSTEKLESIRQEQIRVLHLIAGIIMLGIAVVMVLSIMKGWV
jgi:cytochrome c biogenesis protein CcdA/glutaredoxin